MAVSRLSVVFEDKDIVGISSFDEVSVYAVEARVVVSLWFRE